MTDKTGVRNWTEAPWVAYDDNETFPRGSAEVATVASVGGWIVGVPTPGFPGGNYRDIESGTEEADARLIAAAPELADHLAFAYKLLRPLVGIGNTVQVEAMATVLRKAGAME